MPYTRSAGLLLHPTSLPGPDGIGTIGEDARRFIDLLVDAGVRLWQILPLVPTGYGDSPYAGFSAFAGNPLLLSLEPLLDRGWLRPEDVAALSSSKPLSVDFGTVVPGKMAVLKRSFSHFRADASQHQEFESFCRANGHWLDDFALFMALKDAHGGAPWEAWEPDVRRREQSALTRSAQELEADIAFHRFVQFLFFQQWSDLKSYANRRGVRIVGDIPIFVAYDSADVWAHQDLFQLDAEGRPRVVAGVPPDYFSRTGQLWGNPHYRWDVMERDGFRWWIERFRILLQTVDIVRLDHFRGFAAAWAIPYGNDTAEQGRWVEGPGAALFATIRAALGELPIIAEDLGVITPDVVELRERFGFPGMQILQFAFASDWHDPSLPYNYASNSVVYTGTHDNDTTVGWFTKLSDTERGKVCRYLGTQGIDISWDLIRLAMASVADLAIVPLQDVLRLGSAARMNLPARAAGNWQWRFTWDALSDAHVSDLRMLSETYGRTAGGS